MNDNGEIINVKDYQIVEFTSRERKPSQKSIDIVPLTWITYDQKGKKLKCPFPPFPYENLQSMVKNCAPYNDDWQKYTIEIKGEARTYKKAEKKLKNLQRGMPYAFTTDSDTDWKIKASGIERAIQIKNLQEQGTLMKSKINFMQKEQTTHNETNNTYNAASQQQLEIPILHDSLTPLNINDIIECADSELILDAVIGNNNERETLLQVPETYSTNMLQSISPNVLLQNSTSKKINVDEKVINDIMKRLISIKEELKLNNTIIENIHQLMQVNHSLISDLALTEKYEIQLPFQTPIQLNLFEKKLGENRECRNDTIAAMKLLIDIEKLSKSVLNILKKFLSRNVAMKYTATKQMEGKYVLKLNVPIFCKCIIETLISAHKVTEIKVIAALGTVLTNSKDWDNNRALRTKKTTNISVPAETLTNDVSNNENV